MVEYTEPQDWDFDFLKTVPACQDLSRPPQVDNLLGKDSWFSAYHPQLFEVNFHSRRTSSFGGRRLSGKARRCSARIGKENQGNADELADDSSKFPGLAGGMFSPVRARIDNSAKSASEATAPTSEAAATSPPEASWERKDPMRSRLRAYQVQKMATSSGKPGGALKQPLKAGSGKAAGGADRRPSGRRDGGGLMKPTATSAARQLPATTRAVGSSGSSQSGSTMSLASGGTIKVTVTNRPGAVARLKPAGAATATTSSSSSTTSTTAASSSQSRKRPALVSEDEEMKRQVALHNKRFRPQHTYQPSLSFKVTRKWEQRTGKQYRSLTMQEREQANAEIMAMEQEQQQ